MATAPLIQVVQQLRRVAARQEWAAADDGQLLGRFIEHRDEAAFASLVTRHEAMVMGVCRRVLANPHDCEDAFQATFLVLVRKATSVCPREMVGNWLHGVAYHTALKARAQASKRRARERQVAQLPEPEAAPADCGAELRALLDQELSRLPDKYRAPLVVCDLEGRTRQDAARQLGCPEGTVAGRLARARALLSRRLSRHGLALSSASLAAALASSPASAKVPASLAAGTVEAATALAAGQAAAGIVSGQVFSLMEGVVQSMAWTKFKLTTAMLLAVAIVGAGVASLPSLTAESTPVRDPFAPSAVAANADEDKKKDSQNKDKDDKNKNDKDDKKKNDKDDKNKNDEEKVPLDKLPKPVVEAVKKRFPEAKLVSAEKENDGGKPVYEVAITDKGQKIEVTLTPDGNITEIEKQIAAKDLPEKVKSALDAKYPKATFKIIEEVIHVKEGKESLHYYEVLLVTEEKKTVEVSVTPEGKIAKEEKKDKKEEKK